MIDLRDVARRVALAFGAGFVVVVPAAARMLRRWHSAVDVREPSEEVRDNLPGTFERHLPGLRGKIAHYQLGEFPTPIGTLSFEDPKTEKTFVVSLKREDMSSTLYGGNKVRTLEFQLACAAEAIKDVHGGGAISPVGGPGSNQVARLPMAEDFGFFDSLPRSFGASGVALCRLSQPRSMQPTSVCLAPTSWLPQKARRWTTP